MNEYKDGIVETETECIITRVNTKSESIVSSHLHRFLSVFTQPAFDFARRDGYKGIAKNRLICDASSKKNKLRLAKSIR